MSKKREKRDYEKAPKKSPRKRRRKREGKERESKRWPKMIKSKISEIFPNLTEVQIKTSFCENFSFEV